jgi:hypothetical protein
MVCFDNLELEYLIPAVATKPFQYRSFFCSAVGYFLCIHEILSLHAISCHVN